MAVDKAIDLTEFDSKLTTVADAIRTAGGTTATMSFFFDSDIKQRSIISILHYRLDSFVYDEGSSFTQDGTVFVFANNILTIHFDELGSDTGYYDYNFYNLIGTKVLLMGGNVQ